MKTTDPKKAYFIALTNPLPGMEREYNDWYTNTHLAEVAALDGFVSARRFKLTESQYIASQPYQYVAIYEVEYGRSKAVIDSLTSGILSMTMAPVIDLENGGGFLVESISDTVISTRPR